MMISFLIYQNKMFVRRKFDVSVENSTPKQHCDDGSYCLLRGQKVNILFFLFNYRLKSVIANSHEDDQISHFIFLLKIIFK